MGVDHAIFGPAVFLWYVGIGALTVAMAGGIARRPKPVPAPGPEPEPEAEPEPEPEPADEAEAPADEDEAAVELAEDVGAAEDAGAPADPELDPEEHFVTDTDGTPDATGDDSRGAAD